MKSNLYWHELFDKVERYHREHPSQRYGQAFFNVLDTYRPDLSEMICGTHRDPFHSDYVSDETREYLFRHWLD